MDDSLLQFCHYPSALESKLVSQFCEDERGELIYNRITNGYGNNGYKNNLNGKYSTGSYGYGTTNQGGIQTGQRTVNSVGSGGQSYGGREGTSQTINSATDQVDIQFHNFTYSNIS